MGKSSHNLEYSFKCGARSVHRGNAALFNDEGAKKKATTYYLQEDSIVGLWEKISKTLFYHLPFTIDKIIYLPDTDETLVSSRVSRDSRVSVSVSDSYNAFLQSRSQSQSSIRSFTFDDVTGRESLCSKVSVSVSSLEIF